MSPPPKESCFFPETQKNTNWDEIKFGEGVHMNHLGSKLFFPSIKGGIIDNELQPPPPPHISTKLRFFWSPGLYWTRNRMLTSLTSPVR